MGYLSKKLEQTLGRPANQHTIKTFIFIGGLMIWAAQEFAEAVG